MPLTTGAKLGPYEIVAPIGAGGMGEVYRARDTRLDRSVAIKIVSGDVTTNSELRQRFEREARALSSLSHPNICALYDIGSENGSEYIVMEYLEGETLSKRLERGALPIRELLKTGVEVADALDKAHRQGLVHRDLKPGNIMLTKSGAKLLDFGLAKAQSPAMAAAASFDAATAAHPTSPITQQGFLVGTFQYMSPEQVQGREADSRSDIFAFGAVLYEMATGKRAFDGKSQIGIASAILEKDPEPISSVHALAPPALEHIVERALAKDPDERWQSASDIKAELKWIAASGSQPGLAHATAGKRSRIRASWALVGILAGVAVVLASILIERPAAPQKMIRSTILPPEGTTLTSSGIFAAPMELSPDGSKLLFVARKGEEPQMIWVRSLDSGIAKPLAGTENATRPFWSHDSKSIGFFADRKLKKIDTTGGPVFTLADATEGRGGSWNAQGTIIFSPTAASNIFAVSAGGGPVRPVTHLDPAENETTHRWPEFLPDGKHFLYLTRHSGAGAGLHPAIFVGSIDGGEPKHVLEAGSNVKYVPGYILYVRERALIAQRFDDKKLETSGDPITLSDDIKMDERFTRGVFSASQNDILAFETGAAASQSSLRVVSRSDSEMHAARDVGEASEYFNGGDPDISPDGKSALAAIVDLRSGQADIWQIDLASGNRARLTGGSDVYTAAWSPDGKQIAYSVSNDSGLNYRLMKQATSGSAAAEELYLEKGGLTEVAQWSPDGRALLYGKYMGNEARATDLIWSLPLAGSHQPAALFNGSAYYSTPQVSPDGHFIAFTSDESGRDEVYVTSYPPQGRRWQISQNGGREPRWRRDRKELFFFAADNRLQAVPVKISGSDFEAGPPQPLFYVSMKGVGVWRYDVLPDGQHFLVTVAKDNSTSNITLVTNWTNLLAGK
jgi:eukaryotic-like serine/threonine-protein kinase